MESQARDRSAIFMLVQSIKSDKIFRSIKLIRKGGSQNCPYYPINKEMKKCLSIMQKSI